MYGEKHGGEIPADYAATDCNRMSSSYSELLAKQPCETVVGLNAGMITCMLPISYRLSWEGGNSPGQRQWGREREQPRPHPGAVVWSLGCVGELGSRQGRLHGQAVSDGIRVTASHVVSEETFICLTGKWNLR